MSSSRAEISPSVTRFKPIDCLARDGRRIASSSLFAKLPRR